MGKLILYGTLISPPVRATLLTLHELGLDFEFVEVDVLKGEQKSEEFIKKNPQHTVPVLEDDGDYISDSHAIISYLARRYGKTDSLYPKDYYQRAIVEQRLHFESGTLFVQCLKGLMSSKKVFGEKVKAIEEAYGFLELFLENTTYMAGDHLTIADLSILSTASTLNFVVPIESTKYPKLHSWLDLMKLLPYYEEANAEGLKAIAERIKPFLADLANESKK